jgi:protein-L-isoaspartate(D-aspartate) O-methyltransferase
MKKDELIQLLREKHFSPKILEAFSEVPREDFTPYQFRGKSYEDTALPIGHGQTISQPYTIALMLSNLDIKPGQKVLEVGSGSGYVLALISYLVGKKGRVFGVEVIKELFLKSREKLNDYRNVRVYHKNGSHGLDEEMLFDRIIISAACRNIPEKLMAQLKVSGILVAPVGSRFEQELVIIKRKSESEFEIIKKIPGFIFVPFVDEE